MLFSSIYQSILAQFSRRKLPDNGLYTKYIKNAGIINRNRNNSASCTDNKRITLKISEIREIAI